MLSYLVFSIVKAQTYTVKSGVDYISNDLDYQKGLDKAACENLCTANFQCVGYTLSVGNPANLCWIKSKLANQTDNPLRTTYIKENPAPVADPVALPTNSSTPIIPVLPSPSESPTLPSDIPTPTMAAATSDIPFESPTAIPVLDSPIVNTSTSLIPTPVQRKPVPKKVQTKAKPTPSAPYRTSESNTSSAFSQNTLVYIYITVGLVLLITFCIFVAKYRNIRSKSNAFDLSSLENTQYKSNAPISYLNLPLFRQPSISSKSSFAPGTVYLSDKSVNPSPLFRIPDTPPRISIDPTIESRTTSFQDRTTIGQSQYTQDSFISIDSDYPDSSVSGASSDRIYTTDSYSCRSSSAFVESTFSIKSVAVEKYKSIMTSVYSESTAHSDSN